MKIGMLWIDADSKKSFTEKCNRAIEYYTEKYGKKPTMIMVHPSTIIESLPEVEIKKSRSVLPKHFWVGIEDQMPVYLIHLDKPIKHSQHYIGYALSLDSLPLRIKHHKAGNGARFLQVALERSITFECVRVWDTATRDFERFLKHKYKSARDLCPICNPKTAMKHLPNPDGAIILD